MSAPESIHELVEKFQYNLNEYKNPKYNETQVRVEFINPFWQALGWDVHNRAGYAMAFRDVVHEDEVKVGGSTKAPDYSFRIGGRRIFFLEAKKPSRDLKHDPEPAFQLRRYAYSAKLPISMITDFEELGVYDTRIKPAITDKSHVGRMTYYTFTDYIDKWDEISERFSKEAVMRGAFDRFVEDNTKKKGSAELDRDFLNSLDEWRVLLARNIALRNPQLSERELNFCVQKSIDRLIFLRMAEDRGIETYGTLQALQNGEQAYERLVQIYYRADERYNSGLFHFENKDGDYPDTLTPDLQVDDKVLKEIIKNLYYPCPYEFSQLPVEVLGNAYEQFLGKRITLTGGHRAKIEEKPEVRKAGGVYYTPQYIVDYIVEHTVGDLLKDKTPQQVSELRVLDPACGSGSFLLGAFQYLLDWHLNYYQTEFKQSGSIPGSPPAKGQRPRKSDPQAIFQGAEGQWFLTTAEKKRILLNNIYGVDIDANAVEVTKLSLLLKVLENENSETLHHQLGLWHERALPNLSGNIKCGNSLIGPDYYDNQQSVLFDEEEMLRVNVFDWQQEFSDVFAQGGFDAVIGNPPYIRIQAMKEWAANEVEFYKTIFKTATMGNYDIYILFIENAINLLKDGGELGYILPNKFFTTDYGQSIRELITKKRYLKKIIDFKHIQIFPQVSTYTCLLFLSKKNNPQIYYKLVNDPENQLSYESEIKFDSKLFDSNIWLFQNPAEKLIVEKLFKNSTILLELPSKISRGSSSGADNIFIINKNNDMYETKDGELVKIEEDILRKPIFATDFKRYLFNPQNTNKIIFPYTVSAETYFLVDESNLKNKFPNAIKYLQNKKSQLLKRKQYKSWFGFSAPRNLNLHERAELLVPLLAEKGSFCLIENIKDYCLMASGGFSIKIECELSPLYVLALLNSSLLFWRLKSISNIFRGGWITCTKQYVGKLPIRKIDFTNPAEKAQHDRLVELVQQMLDLHKTLAAARDPRTREQLQRRITATDNQIDRLVYELYELTEEEIKIIEA